MHQPGRRNECSSLGLNVWQTSQQQLSLYSDDCSIEFQTTALEGVKSLAPSKPTGPCSPDGKRTGIVVTEITKTGPSVDIINGE